MLLMVRAGDSFVVDARPVQGWVDAGMVHLDPGAYETSVLLPEGATLEHVEVAPPCVRPYTAKRISPTLGRVWGNT